MNRPDSLKTLKRVTCQRPDEGGDQEERVLTAGYRNRAADATFQ